jgi:lipopolysaccharide export system protein LptC
MTTRVVATITLVLAGCLVVWLVFLSRRRKQRLSGS